MSRHRENTHLRENEPKKYITVQTDEGDFVDFQADPFWKNRPALWFKKIEAQLGICNIDIDMRKFRFIVSLLDEETALEVRDIIVDPPEEDSYELLKEQLIKRIISKNENEAKQRMMVETIGNRKPSEFYSHLNSLAGCCVRDDFVQEVWINCLPSKIRSVLECLLDCPLETLTKVADRVHEILKITSVEQLTNTPATSSLLESLVKEVENLNKKVQMLKSKGQPCRAQSKGRDGQHDRAPLKPKNDATNQTTQNNACRYHTKYGVKFCKLRKDL